MMHFCREAFKTFLSFYWAYLYAADVVEECLMAAKTDIYQISAISLCLLNIRGNHMFVIRNIINLPYHIIPQSKHIDHFVKTVQTRTDFIE
jgi:hypothetical protein